MTCRSGNSDDRFFSQQDHRNISRHWKKAIENLSKTNFNQKLSQNETEKYDDVPRGVRFGYDETSNCQNPCESGPKTPSEAIQKKLAKGKTIVKVKSPLKKFDEIVTKELTIRRLSEEGRMPTFDGTKKWSNFQFPGGKITIENKVSRGALHSVENEVRDSDPSNVQNAALMDAIEKLAQAQAFCRFDAAVKAAEVATASVPPEMAEEVAVACAKDYQAEIVDVINEQMPLSEEKKPIEVIGYIGVTKLKDSL